MRFALLLLPLVLAGPIRAVTHVGLGWALFFACIVSLPLLLRFFRAAPLSLNAAVAALGLFASVVLYNHYLNGLPHTFDAGGQAIDGAVHVFYAFQFRRDQPNVYMSFVSLYGLWSFLGGRALAWNAGLHLAVWSVIAVTCLVAFREKALYVCAALAVPALYFVILPLLAAHQASGFWPHIFSLVPLCMLWAVDALVEPRWVRLVLVTAAAGLLRYTYGLNLADVLAVVAVLFLVESGVPLWLRVGCAAAALWGAHVALDELFATAGKLGWIIRHDAARAHTAQLAAVAAMTVAMFLGASRALRVPVLFCGINAVVAGAVGRVPNPTDYYHQKYALAGLVLAMAGVTVAVAVVAARRRWLALAAVALLAVFSEHQARAAIAPYRPIFDEIAFGKPPFASVRAWYDAGAVDFIDETLRARHKQFGGYRHHFWATGIFTSSIFGLGDANYRAFQNVDFSPGHCGFWEEGVSEYDAFPTKFCRRYHNPHEPGVERSICARCD